MPTNEMKTDSLDRLAQDFWSWRARTQPNSNDDIPRVERPRGWAPDWSRASVRKQREDLAAFENRWKHMNPSSWPVAPQVDYRLIGAAMARVRWELDVLRSWELNPRFYVYQTLGALFEDLLKNRPFDVERSAEIIRCLQRFPRLLEQGKINLADTAIKPFTLATLEIFNDLPQRLTDVARALKPHLAPESASQLEPDMEQAVAALESFRSWLVERLPRMSGEASVGREAYVFFLKNVALMPYTPERLLEMGRQEWERSMTFEAIAQARTPGLPELPLFANQAEQIAKEDEDEQAIRRFLEEQNLLTVPTWMQHYINLPLPDYIAPLASLGVVDDLTSATRLKENGLRYIPPVSPHLGYFELSSVRDPRPLIVHEGVPGHYFQMTQSWAHENPIRRWYYDSGANEGIGFYAEEMMLQAGLFDASPRTREIMYNFMRLRALRVEVDVRLALGSFTIDQATEYLKTKTPMDYDTARAEAVFFASLPGQAITYQIGKLQIVKFLADARQQLGAQFGLRAFHDYLWKNGNVPIALLRWEYLGLDDEIKLLDQNR